MTFRSYFFYIFQKDLLFLKNFFLIKMAKRIQNYIPSKYFNIQENNMYKKVNKLIKVMSPNFKFGAFNLDQHHLHSYRHHHLHHYQTHSLLFQSNPNLSRLQWLLHFIDTCSSKVLRFHHTPQIQELESMTRCLHHLWFFSFNFYIFNKPRL